MAVLRWFWCGFHGEQKASAHQTRFHFYSRFDLTFSRSVEIDALLYVRLLRGYKPFNLPLLRGRGDLFFFFFWRMFVYLDIFIWLQSQQAPKSTVRMVHTL